MRQQVCPEDEAVEEIGDCRGSSRGLGSWSQGGHVHHFERANRWVSISDEEIDRICEIKAVDAWIKEEEMIDNRKDRNFGISNGKESGS
jgi:hypothetical protein